MMKILGLFGTPGADIPANAAGAAMFGANIDPSKLADYDRWRVHQQQGAGSDAAVNATTGAGGAYSGTKPAFEATLGETRRQFDMKPQPALDVQRNPVFGRQGDLTGLSPILSDTERKGTLAGTHFGQMGELPAPEQNYLGADASSRTPRNYIMRDGSNSFITYDGQTDAQSGQPLPPGGYIGNVEGGAGDVGLTNPVRSDLQRRRVSYEKFNALAGMADKLLENKSNFGVVGKVRDVFQEVGQMGLGIAQIMGTNSVPEAMEKVVASLSTANEGRGMSPSLLFGQYDPNLPEIDTVWGLIVYNGASALADASGRDLSDKDVAIMKGILGEPKSVLASAESLRAKLNIARDIIGMYTEIGDRHLGGQQGVAQPTTPTAPAPGAPAPMQQQPAAPSVPRIRLNRDGEVVQ
jgi:hypothetical protein